MNIDLKYPYLKWRRQMTNSSLAGLYEQFPWWLWPHKDWGGIISEHDLLCSRCYPKLSQKYYWSDQNLAQKSQYLAPGLALWHPASVGLKYRSKASSPSLCLNKFCLWDFARTGGKLDPTLGLTKTLSHRCKTTIFLYSSMCSLCPALTRVLVASVSTTPVHGWNLGHRRDKGVCL